MTDPFGGDNEIFRINKSFDSLHQPTLASSQPKNLLTSKQGFRVDPTKWGFSVHARGHRARTRAYLFALANVHRALRYCSSLKSLAQIVTQLIATQRIHPLQTCDILPSRWTQLCRLSRALREKKLADLTEPLFRHGQTSFSAD